MLLVCLVPVGVYAQPTDQSSGPFICCYMSPFDFAVSLPSYLACEQRQVDLYQVGLDVKTKERVYITFWKYSTSFEGKKHLSNW